MNNISKKYDIVLDTKSAKIYKNNMIFNVGDDITLNIDIVEDGNPKDLTDCKVDIVVDNTTNPNPIIHRFEDGGITILNSSNGIVVIKCKGDYINREGSNICQIFISDQDETISTQRFIFVTNKNISTDIMKSAEDEIDTLRKLEETIIEYASKLEDITDESNNMISIFNENDEKLKNHIKESEKYIVDEIEIINSKVEELSENIENKIDEISNKVDYQLSKVVKLKNTTLPASTTIGFITNAIIENANTLVRCCYNVHVSGSPSSTQIINSAFGSLGFYKEVVNGQELVKSKIFVLQDISIQGRQLTPSSWFLKSDNTITDSISPNETNYKILIKANVHQNNIDSGMCFFSPNGLQINL